MASGSRTVTNSVIFDDMVGEILAEERRRNREGKVHIAFRDAEWQNAKMGKTLYYAHPIISEHAIRDWCVFIHEIHGQSGAHTHQGGVLIYVIEGQGYTNIDGERTNWKAGDVLLLPIKLGGVSHQHFSEGDAPARFIAFLYMPFREALGGDWKITTTHAEAQAEAEANLESK